MKAIHDRYYVTPPESFMDLRWRIQHIAEEEVGRRVREVQMREDEAAKLALEQLDGLG